MTDGVLELGEGAYALFTSQAHGNLSSVAGDGHEHGVQARARLRAGLGLERLVRGYQVHGSVVGRVFSGHPQDRGQNVLSHDEEADALSRAKETGALSHDEEAGASAAGASQPAFRADGHAVAAPGIAAMVLVADCVPVVLSACGAVAALHAGWRGLAAGVLEEGIRALRDVGGRGPVRAVIGPCAGACCYEAGGEVHAALGHAARAMPSNIDLRAIARQWLLIAGAARVDDVEACTICDTRFFSHRREGARAGRQAALAWLTHA